MSETHVGLRRTNWSNSWLGTSSSAVPSHNSYPLHDALKGAATVEHKVNTTLICALQQLCGRVEPCGLRDGSEDAETWRVPYAP